MRSCTRRRRRRQIIIIIIRIIIIRIIIRRIIQAQEEEEEEGELTEEGASNRKRTRGRKTGSQGHEGRVPLAVQRLLFALLEEHEEI